MISVPDLSRRLKTTIMDAQALGLSVDDCRRGLAAATTSPSYLRSVVTNLGHDAEETLSLPLQHSTMELVGSHPMTYKKDWNP